MPTIAAPTSISRSEKTHSPIIYIKATWADDWVFEPNLNVSRGTATTAAHDMPTLELRRWYGEGKSPHGIGKYTRTPINLDGYWVRMKLVGGDHGLYTEWVGRIETESRVTPRDGSTVQYWTAYGPLQILCKVHVGTSIWYQDAQEQTIGWLPDVNAGDRMDMRFGNRSAEKSGDSYLYGGTSAWSHYEYLEYVLKRYVQGESGPRWHIGGHSADALKSIKTLVAMSPAQSVADIVRKLISTRLGFDYQIVPVFDEDHPEDDGFEIRIFALTAKDWSVGGATLPRNPVTFDIRTSDEKHIQSAQIVNSREHRHGRIVIQGRRIVVCCSLYGAEAIPGWGINTLAGKWTAGDEATYLAGTGTPGDDPQLHDQARANERYRPVFQFFGAPADWDWNGGLARVELDPHGNTIPMSTGDYQNEVRRTLRTLPLLENVDYSTYPPTEHIPSGHKPDFRGPEVWLYDTGAGAKEGAPLALGWVSAEEAEIGVTAPGSDWGVILSASPNHRLALNHWDGAADTAREPVYDYEKMVATIALETDKRFELVYTAPDWTPEDGVIYVPAPNAELHYLAPDTVVGVDENGALKHSPSEGYVLRNDAGHMAMILAGALSRYRDARSKAEITYAGLRPYSHWLGQILRVIEAGGDTHDVDAPITAIEWNVPIEGSGKSEPTTVIRTGFAR